MKINHYSPEPWVSSSLCNEFCTCKRFGSETALLVSDQLPNLLARIKTYGKQSNRELKITSFSVEILGNMFENSAEWPAETQPKPLSVSPRMRLLLDPFTLLYGVKSLMIEGQVNEEYKRSVVSSAMQPEPTTAEIITTALGIQNRGDEAFHEEQYDRSLSLYTSALREVQVNHRPGSYTGALELTEYAGMKIEYAVDLLMVTLQVKLAGTLVQLGEFSRALDSIDLASEVLDDVKEMHDAAAHHPGNGGFKQVYERLGGEIRLQERAAAKCLVRYG